VFRCGRCAPLTIQPPRHNHNIFTSPFFPAVGSILAALKDYSLNSNMMGSFLDRKPAVLIVDDEKDLLTLMQYKLRMEGFQVQISKNAENVLDIITETHPDIILLDIHMNGVDGGTICKLLKDNKSTAHIPILMFSANMNIDNIAKECGADGYITKPFDPAKAKEEFLKILGPGYTQQLQTE
jgi:CheY-like chemotaxis protein